MPASSANSSDIRIQRRTLEKTHGFRDKHLEGTTREELQRNKLKQDKARDKRKTLRDGMRARLDNAQKINKLFRIKKESKLQDDIIQAANDGMQADIAEKEDVIAEVSEDENKEAKKIQAAVRGSKGRSVAKKARADMRKRSEERREALIRAKVAEGGDDDAGRYDGELSPGDSSTSTGSPSKRSAPPSSSKRPQGPQGPQGPQDGMSNMLLPLMLMRGGLGGNKPNDEELKALHEQNEKDKAAAKEAIDKMKSLMLTLEELKETVKKEHEKMDKRNEQKGCKCPSNSKIEKKVEELSDKLEESDVVEALNKCRKTLKKYKTHLEKLHAYSIYLQKLTVKIQHKLKHNIKKAKSLCSNKKRKKSSKSKKK